MDTICLKKAFSFLLCKKVLIFNDVKYIDRKIQIMFLVFVFAFFFNKLLILFVHICINTHTFCNPITLIKIFVVNHFEIAMCSTVGCGKFE